MSIFGRRITPEQLASELLSGLESGEIEFDEELNESSVAEQTAALLADRVTKLVEATLEPLRDQLRTATEQAVAALKQAEEARKHAEDEAAKLLSEARAVLAEAVRTAEQLRSAESLKG